MGLWGGSSWLYVATCTATDTDKGKMINGGTTDHYQSINQINFYSANIPGEARLSGATARSVFKNVVVEVISKHQQTIEHTGVYGGKAKSKKVCFETLSEGSN